MQAESLLSIGQFYYSMSEKYADLIFYTLKTIAS